MFVNSLGGALTFWNPAINYSAINQRAIGRFNIDQTVIAIRQVAIYTLAALGLVFALKTSFYLFVGSCIFFALSSRGKNFEKFEKDRAKKILDQIAVDLFKSPKDVPVDAMIYASSTTSVVKSLLASRELISKVNAKFKLNVTFIAMENVGLKPLPLRVSNLDFEKVIYKRKDGSQFIDLVRRRNVKNTAIDRAYINGLLKVDFEDSMNILKVLIEGKTFKKGMANHHYLAKIMEKRELALYALEKGGIEQSDFKEMDLIYLWTRVQDNDVVERLKQKGFSIDLADRSGRTPLIQAIVEMSTTQVIFLLNNGAKLPTGNEVIDLIEVGVDCSLKNISITVDNFLADKPDLLKALNVIL